MKNTLKHSVILGLFLISHISMSSEKKSPSSTAPSTPPSGPSTTPSNQSTGAPSTPNNTFKSPGGATWRIGGASSVTFSQY